MKNKYLTQVDMIKSVIKYIEEKVKLNKFISIFRNDSTTSVLIYDDIYPNPISGFRYEEFNVILEYFKSSKILVTSGSYRYLNQPEILHKKHIHDVLLKFPHFKKKIIIYDISKKEKPNLFYCVFYHNINRHFEWLQHDKIPFIFTLYPGGGFRFCDKDIDKRLKIIFNSKFFRHVIVNQKVVRDYLISNNLCEAEKIKLIFGVVTPQNSIKKLIIHKKYFKYDKDTLDICFCAAKYMPKGIDKGYDLFIEFAKQIANKYDFIKFHVIGGFDSGDIDISSIEPNIEFYGYLNYEELNMVFSKTDLIISPNRPFKLCNGGFDGFPLGSTVEAALNGAVALVTDELNENVVFEDKIDLIIIKPKVESIIAEVEYLIKNPQKIKQISENGITKFSRIYSSEHQMIPRLQLIEKEIHSNE